MSNISIFKGRDFLKLLDFTPEEIGAFLDLAADLKKQKKEGRGERTHQGGSRVQQLRAQSLELGRTGLQIHAWTSYVRSLWACC